jgi:hypothetical protein
MHTAQPRASRVGMVRRNGTTRRLWSFGSCAESIDAEATGHVFRRCTSCSPESGRVLPGDGKLVAVPEPFEVAADYVLDVL